jgi:hypothetical protein
LYFAGLSGKANDGDKNRSRNEGDSRKGRAETWSDFYIALTIAFTVYGQVVIRAGIAGGRIPPDFSDKIWFIGRLLLNSG